MKPISQVKVRDTSTEDQDSMSDEEEDWGGTGAFPGSSPTTGLSPIKGGDGKNSIFANEAFQGSFKSLEVVAEGSRETNTSSSQDGLMALSHSSSDTPSMSNTAAAVREALKKNKIQSTKQSGSSAGGGGSGKGGFYPFNIYRSLSKDKEERQESEDKQKGRRSTSSVAALATVASASASSATANGRNINSSSKKDYEQVMTPPPILPSMEDENSSAFTDEHQQERYPYVMDSGSLQDTQSISVVSARRPRGGNKQYWNRYASTSSPQLPTNPASLLKNLFIGIEAERQMNRLTALHLRAIHNWFLFLPAILLTLSAGVVVLVFEADLNTNSDVTVYASIAVGVASLVSVFWQALSKQLDLGAKAALHDATSIALKRLSEDILLTLSAADTTPAEYVSLIGEKASQAIDGCPSRVPIKLDAAFSAMSDRMVLMLRPPIGQAPRKYVHNKLDFIRLYTTAYDELSAEMIDYFAFPFSFPNPRVASDAALRNFKTIITEGRDVEGRNRHCRKWLCPCFAAHDEERSLFDVLPAVTIMHQEGGGDGGGASASYPIRHSMMGTSV